MPRSFSVTLPAPPRRERLDPDLCETTARYRFDLKDGPSFTLLLDHGRLAVEDPPSATADCAVTCTGEEAERILRGDENVLTAFMRGELRLETPAALDLAKRLYRFLRAAKGQGESR
jgi:putative sterol carrier protein